jgi:hypothetical protein
VTIRLSAIAGGLVSAVFASAPWHALAADNQAGTPLAPADAAGPWTLESGGRAICVLNLGKEKIGAASFALTVPMACGNALPTDLVGWAPTADGMSLVGAGGHSVMGFNRWSNSLLVSHRSSGADLQLKRGGPNP